MAKSSKSHTTRLQPRLFGHEGHAAVVEHETRYADSTRALRAVECRLGVAQPQELFKTSDVRAYIHRLVMRVVRCLPLDIHAVGARCHTVDSYHNSAKFIRSSVLAGSTRKCKVNKSAPYAETVRQIAARQLLISAPHSVRKPHRKPRRHRKFPRRSHDTCGHINIPHVCGRSTSARQYPARCATSNVTETDGNQIHAADRIKPHGSKKSHGRIFCARGIRRRPRPPATVYRQSPPSRACRLHVYSVLRPDRLS